MKSAGVSHAGANDTSLRVGAASWAAGDLHECSCVSLEHLGAGAEEDERLPRDRRRPPLEAGQARCGQ